jgi:hypothetical protein
MPVICAACQTENRDAAKFCHGCARKLPGFAATGPSLLDGLGSKRASGAAAGHRSGAAAQNAPREFWLGLGAVMLAMAVGFGGWFGYVTRKVPAPASHAAPVAVAPPAPPQPVEAPRSSEPVPVPLGSSLSAGEAEVTGKPPMPPAGVAAAPAPPPATPAAVERRPAPAPAPPARAAALDPRQGCQNLNFFSAARCEAAHCDQPAYTRHPRCNEVRADRRRDEARRNPMLGT